MFAIPNIEARHALLTHPAYFDHFPCVCVPLANVRPPRGRLIPPSAWRRRIEDGVQGLGLSWVKP